MDLYSFFVILPLIIALITVIYTVVSNIGRIWLDHRVKMALLEKLEDKPELLRSFNELQDLLDGSPQSHVEKPRQDLIVTGVVLALIGAASAIIASNYGGGQWATGIYFGGVACVPLGFILALLGLLVRFMMRSPIRDDKDE